MTRSQAILTLFLIAAITGGIAPVSKIGLGGIAPLNLFALRFLLAAFALLCIFPRSFSAPKGTLIAGGVVGATLTWALACFVIGLQSAPAWKTAFAISSSVFLVPLLKYFYNRTIPSRTVCIGIVLSGTGLVLLLLKEDLTLAVTDIWLLLSALGFSFFFIANSHYAPRCEPTELWIVQTCAAALLFSAGTLIFEHFTFQFSTQSLLCVLYLAIPATAFRLVFQCRAQNVLDATLTGLIFAIEPVFAGLYSWTLLQEQISLRQFIGCVLVFLGSVLVPLVRLSSHGSVSKDLRNV